MGMRERQHTATTPTHPSGAPDRGNDDQRTSTENAFSNHGCAVILRFVGRSTGSSSSISWRNSFRAGENDRCCLGGGEGGGCVECGGGGGGGGGGRGGVVRGEKCVVVVVVV